ncbi:MAG: glutathione S-transferase C-terminal domain-containing protein [Thermoplasmata archaeon]|nr:glutathione S-transferase C-terminal domain-containing protein [Thermoplasmata archaeon]
MAGLPRLYYQPISHYCVSAERMLAYKRIRYQLVHVPYHDRRNLIAATHQDYLPAWVEGRSVVRWDALADHFEKLAPRPTLYPARSRGLARALENWGHQVVEERVWRYVVTEVGAKLQGEPERWVFEELQSRARGPWELLRYRQAEFRREMLTYLALLEEMLAHRTWLLGEPSLADFGIYGSLSPLFFVGRKIPPSLRHLGSWCRRIAALPSSAS